MTASAGRNGCGTPFVSLKVHPSGGVLGNCGREYRTKYRTGYGIKRCQDFSTSPIWAFSGGQHDH